VVMVCSVSIIIRVGVLSSNQVRAVMAINAMQVMPTHTLAFSSAMNRRINSMDSPACLR
jgi:hypothetical protein